MAQSLHSCIVLDRSGSMESCRTDALGAVNSFLRQMKEDKASDTRVTLIIFDSDSIDVIRDKVPVGTCAELKPEEYQPRASTPLFDAVGRGVSLLDASAKTGERQSLAIMTDGMENASREYNRETLKRLLDRKQKEDGWLITYLGADHDAWDQAAAMGLQAGNVASYSKSKLSSTADALYARQARYMAAPSPVQDAMSGGYTDEERASIDDDTPPSKTKKKH